MANPDKSVLRPTGLERIYDVVAAAGIDVSAWHQGKGDYASNPNFCYRWAFAGDKTALLCLWLHAIEWVDGAWAWDGNARTRQMERERAGADHWDPAVRNRTKRWAKSAIQLDDVLKQAHRNKLDVRVCIIDTRNWISELETNSADYRGLDPQPWQLTYDMMTGDYSVRRNSEESLTASIQGFEKAVSPVTTLDAFEATERPTATNESDDALILNAHIEASALPEISATSYGVGVVDQFIIDGARGEPLSVERFERERSVIVRQLVMARSQGKCEWCGQPGFVKHDGQIYLESHHVVPLNEDGDDTVENIIALCPNDHRLAHYGERRQFLVEEMLIRVKERNSINK